jgi:hypothetical protein
VGRALPRRPHHHHASHTHTASLTTQQTQHRQTKTKKASRRIPWEAVTAADRLLLSPRQLREKYVAKK